MTRLKKIGLSFSVMLIAGVIVLIVSCNVSKPATTYSYLYQKNASIDVDTTTQITKNGNKISVLHFSIGKGNNLVFIYRKMKAGPENIKDGGGIHRTLVFEISADTAKFDYQNGKLQKLQAFYRSDCSLCPEGGIAVPVNHGLIRGERVNPVTWIIKVDATVKYFGKTIHLKFDEPFYQQSLLQ